MGRRLDNSDRGGLITVEAVRRLARAAQRVENGGRNIKPPALRTAFDEGGDPVRLGKTTADWDKGTLATIELYEEGTPPGETKKSPAETLADCVNKFSDVATEKWVMVAKAANGSWYLISAEC